MMSNYFEEAFNHFLERREYDKAENALFSIVRIAFVAGWISAGGDPPQPQRILEIVHKEIITTHEDIESDLKSEIE